MDTRTDDLQRARRAQALSGTERLLQDRTQAHKTAIREHGLATAQLGKAQSANDTAQALLTQVESQAPQRTEASRRVDRLAALTDKAAELEAARRSADATAQMASAHIRAAQDARDHAHAARLALSLQTDEPCPVCGSEAHPSPAESHLEDPNLVSIDNARLTRDRAEEELSSAQARSQEVQHRHAQLCAEQTLAESTLSNVSPELRAALPQHGNTPPTGELSNAIQAHTAAAKALEIHLAAVPESLRGPGEITRAQTAAQEELSRLTLALNHARESAQETHALLAAQAANTSGAQKAQKQADDRLEEAQSELHKRITEAGFSSPQDYESARRTDEDIHELEARLQQWREQRARAEERAQSASRAAEPKRCPVATGSCVSRFPRIPSQLSGIWTPPGPVPAAYTSRHAPRTPNRLPWRSPPRDEPRRTTGCRLCR